MEKEENNGIDYENSTVVVSGVGNNIKLGVLGIFLMILFSKMLVIKPVKIGFFDGIIFSWVYGQVFNASSEIANIILITIAAFVTSFFFMQHNRMKLFYGIIVLTVVRWIMDIFYAYRFFDGGKGFEIKLWAMFCFFTGAILVYNNLLVKK